MGRPYSALDYSKSQETFWAWILRVKQIEFSFVTVLQKHKSVNEF